MFKWINEPYTRIEGLASMLLMAAFIMWGFIAFMVPIFNAEADAGMYKYDPRCGAAKDAIDNILREETP